MGKNTRRKIVTLMLAAIAGECVALLLILLVLIYTAPTGTSQTEVEAAGIQDGATASAQQKPADGIQHVLAAGAQQEPAANNPCNIEALVTVKNSKLLITENIRLKPGSGSLKLYLPSVNKAKTVVKSILYNGKPALYDRKDTDLWIIQAKNKGTVTIEYEIYLSGEPEILSYSKSRILLTNFLAVPAVYKNFSPLTSYSSKLGDPYRYDIFNYRVELTADKSYTAYGPGKKSDVLQNNLRVTVFESENLRDFPVVLMSNASLSTIKQGNTDIILINAGSAGSHAQYALKYAKNMIGPYPYKELFIVAADFPLRGMEFSNMVFISEKCFRDKEVLRRVIYHEVLHQWFYGIIGTDQLDEPFMDEGLVTFLTSLMCGDKLPAAYNRSFMDKSLRDYSSKQAYNDLAYLNASSYFGELHKKMGNNFNNLLKKIYNEKKFKILYFEEFKQYLTEFSRGK